MDALIKEQTCIFFVAHSFLAASQKIDRAAEIFAAGSHESSRRENVRIGLDSLGRNPIGKIKELVFTAKIHGLTLEVRLVVIKIRADIDQGFLAAHFSRDKLHLAALAIMGIALINVTDMAAMDLDLADVHICVLASLYIKEDINESVRGISFESRKTTSTSLFLPALI